MPSSSTRESDFKAPIGEIEETLAAIWSELLHVDQVGRDDHFFDLGGSSFLIMQMTARLRREGFSINVADFVAAPTLSDLAASLETHRAVTAPVNAIKADSRAITPRMLPLIDLSQQDIDHVVAQVPGAAANVQDIYGLTPLQEGMLFHHLRAKVGDPYITHEQMAFAERGLLDRYLAAMQQVVDRHDILRTTFIWKQIAKPVQVVCRQASLVTTELVLDHRNGPVSEQLAAHLDSRHCRIDLGQAPLMCFAAVFDGEHDRWLLQRVMHHLIVDHWTLRTVDDEIQTILDGRAQDLSTPVSFRSLVAQARLGIDEKEHERFFREMLGDIDEPTLPFGLDNVHLDGNQIVEASVILPRELNERLRRQARRVGVSLACLCHLAWGQVVSKASGRTEVVFGTVLSGRMHGGEDADRALGPFINTLPLRLSFDETGVEESAQRTQRILAGLLRHEHASLALAQRRSAVAAPTPLFSALFNYRQNALPAATARHDGNGAFINDGLEGIEWLSGGERTNYPLTMSVDDFGDALSLTAQVAAPFSPEQICGYVQQALESLVGALENSPDMPVRSVDILPAEAQRHLQEEPVWHALAANMPASADFGSDLTENHGGNSDNFHSAERISQENRDLEEAGNIIREIWQRAMALENIGLDDDFFQLGGHSLLATRIVRLISDRFSVDVPIEVLFEETATPRSLAEHVFSKMPYKN